MAHLGVDYLEALLKQYAANPDQGRKDEQGKAYVYCETGRYKFYMPATISAIARRGYRVVRSGQGVYRVYPRPPEPAHAATDATHPIT